ncbi:MAG: YkgJ family cysteine cluster protein [Lentisphaeria bacterium]|nr:YkgJ family cysteine cluster protein [Lentisphaeria bacterium]
MSFECRTACGMCCIIPSIAQPIPNMPNGKPAFQPCVNLDTRTLECKIWETVSYPNLCRRFKAAEDTCGESAQEAKEILSHLERETS